VNHMFKKIGNCLLVDNLERSLEFYVSKLGLEIRNQDGKFVDFKNTSLSLFQKDEAVGMFPVKFMGKGGGVILAIQVDNLEKSCLNLETKGVQIFAGPKTTAWGQKVAYFNDPDGNIWEVSEPFEEKQ